MPYRIWVQSDDNELNASLQKINPVLLQARQDTMVSIRSTRSTNQELQFASRLGDTSRAININKLLLPFPKNKAYKLIQGHNSEPTHNTDYSRYALDFGLKEGDTVCAATDGFVVGVIEENKRGGADEKYRKYGNYITIYDPRSGIYTQYVHLLYKGSFVAVGDQVKAGQPIGLSGMTGQTNIEHLHFNCLIPIHSEEGFMSIPVDSIGNYNVAGMKRNEMIYNNDYKILDQLIAKLNSINTIEYQHLFQIVDRNRNITSYDTAICYFDFSEKDNLIGARYHFQSRYGEEVYNGTTEFSFQKEERIILFNENPNTDFLTGSFWMQNSLFALRSMLPKMMNDPGISILQQPDKVIGNLQYYHYKIDWKNRNIQDGIDIIEQEGLSFEQELLIDKGTFLPYSYGTIYPNDKGFKLVTFQNLDLQASRPDAVWTYENYPQDLKRLTYKEFYSRQANSATKKTGRTAPTWKLPMVEGDSVSLSEQAGKLVLLEFWFPYCKGCIEAVSDINEIRQKYKSRGLEVYGIETLNSDYQMLHNYIKKYHIDYPTLYNGKSVARDYGTHAAPTFVLIDRKGIIVYLKEGFLKDELLKIIEENI